MTFAAQYPPGSSSVIITNITPGTGPTDLGKAEDAPHVSGDVGVEILAVRRDTAIAGCADGDYATVNVDANGKLWTSPAVNTVDSIASVLATSTVMNGATALTVKFAFANIAASTTDGAIVAAVTSKKIRVLAYSLVAAGTATNATFTSKPGGSGTAISSLKACAANGGISCATGPLGYFETASGEGLSLTTGSGSTIGVDVTYCEV